MTTNPAKILIVGGEDSLRRKMAEDFQNQGFVVFDSACIHKAFEIVQQNEVDVVLTDMYISNGDGLTLLTTIRNKNRIKPVVFLIIEPAEISSEDAYELGADAVLNKPLDPKALFKTVHDKLLPDIKKWRFSDTDKIADAFHLDLTLGNIEESISSKLINIGRGGFFVACDDPLPQVGSRIQYALHFTGEKFRTLSGEGVVRWVRQNHPTLPSGFGVEFIAMSENDRKLILQWISSANEKSYIPKS